MIFYSQVIIIAPIIMVIVALYLVITPFKSSPIGCTSALIMILLGLPVYYIFIYRKLLPDCCFTGLGK
eukprot:Seg1927.6 transcript_id=Seg1927.6/GoldUCD/mRNA.D3Y31 product="hypothetical protein" protein_id=Seg1927.6/GoldUCD/D3Y31